MVAVSLVAATPVKTSASAQSGQILAQSNPCAGKNPCASKKGNVGGPLARQLQGKPVVVDIYASWCPACKNIAPPGFSPS
jgi:thiol-disulfide isomerase/thioredoxin